MRNLKGIKIFQLAENQHGPAYNDFPEDICVWSETTRPVLPVAFEIRVSHEGKLSSFLCLVTLGF